MVQTLLKTQTAMVQTLLKIQTAMVQTLLKTQTAMVQIILTTGTALEDPDGREWTSITEDKNSHGPKRMDRHY